MFGSINRAEAAVLPPRFEDYVSLDQRVRVFANTVKALDVSASLAGYQAGVRRASYLPVMLLTL